MKELQLKAQELSKQGLSTRAVARELGLTPSRAYNMISGKYSYDGPKKAPVDRIKELRKQGMMVSDIATNLGVSESTVSRYAVGLGDKMCSGKDGAIELRKKGLSRSEIASIMGVKKSSVSSYLSGSGVATGGENKELAICLRMDGYYLDEVSDIMGVSKDYVSQLTSGHGPFARRKTQVCIKGEVKPKKIKMKKEVKQTVSAIEQREVIGKGITSGTYSLEVRLNPNRDDGILLGISYQDFGGSIKKVQIRVNDIEDKESRAKKWCDKHKKKYINYF